MQGNGLHESLARDRNRFERLLFARMGGAITREDAEDIVSDALVRAGLKLAADPPRPGSEEAWFARIVLNQGIDFIRARDGRKRNGSIGRPKVVPLRELDEEADALADDPDTAATLGDASEREQARALVGRVMSSLDPKDAELVKLCHLVGAAASREQVATMAGLTVGEFRWRYTRAWNRFVEAIAGEAPTERCDHVRQLLGDAEAGVATHEQVAEIDAHTLDCVSCRVFARESYRALELIPFAPVVPAAERWSARIGWWWERSNPEVATGAGAAAGAGILSLFGGAAGVVKVVAIVCSATAVTAGICAGVAEILRDPPAPPPATAKPPAPKRAAATPTPTAAPTSTPQPRRRTTTARPKRSTKVDLSGNKQIPASAPPGSQEFTPAGSGAPAEPAPAPPAGGGEFAP